jgi:two-component system, NtrC family, sensor kinase
MGLYARSVEVNRLWASKLSEFELLRSLAAKVNAPGNDVFDNQDFASESARMLSARDRFESKLAAVRAAIQQEAAPAEKAELLAAIAEVAVAMDSMTAEAVDLHLFC